MLSQPSSCCFAWITRRRLRFGGAGACAAAYICACFFACAVAALVGPTVAYAQAPSRPVATTAVKIANLQEDVHGLRTELGKLTLENEELRRRNDQLASRLVEMETAMETLVRAAMLDNALASLRQELTAEGEARNRLLIEKISAQIEALTTKTNQSLEALAAQVNQATASVATAATTEPALFFSDDYPKEGIAYTVQSGDTLSAIAQKLGSTVKDIQNANQIANPREIRPGQRLFIPQRK